LIAACHRVLAMPFRNGAGIALLADPTRRRLIAALAIRPARPSKLADLLELSRFTVSRQLRLLREAGLVVDHRLEGDGRGSLYMINDRRHGAITAWLAGTDVGRTLDPAAAAGIPPGRRADNDPWREFRAGPRPRAAVGSDANGGATD
jgi:DNA-binding transcriptional ArsR family regulator